MLLEFLEAGSQDCPLIRLYDFEPEEAIRLQELVRDLATGVQTEIDLELLCALVDDCHLVLVAADENRGILEGQEQHFRCELTRDRWAEMIDIIAPFTKERRKHTWYNWLDETSDISLLLSPNGGW